MQEQRLVKCRDGQLVVDIVDNQPLNVSWQLHAHGYVVAKRMERLSWSEVRRLIDDLGGALSIEVVR
jgi:hypothetical protein